MKNIIILLLVIVTTSCVPIAIAPDLENGKVIKGKKFQRKLPNRYTYVFNDPKNADEFYYFVNAKFDCNHQYVEDNVPVEINGKTFYLSFYEAEKTTTTINLIPILIDAKRESNGKDPILENVHASRNGKWYILLMITADDFEDGLNPESEHYNDVEVFAQNLKDEYYKTSNYNQLLLGNSK